jgi:hypothetical protein
LYSLRKLIIPSLIIAAVVSLILLNSCDLFRGGNGNGGDGDYGGYPPAVADLPDISAIMLSPSDTFISPLDQFSPAGLVEGIIPMPGTDSGSCYHPGAHVEYVATSTQEVVDIYAPLDGVITHVDKCFPTEGTYYDQQYKIHMAYAQRDGDLFELELGMEPMAGKPCDGDPDYFSPYILVSEGEEVSKGQLIGRMVLLPGYKSHIHFNSKFRGIFMCPDIFNTAVIDVLDDHYVASCEGNPFSSISVGTICYLPSLGESHAHY